MSGKDRSGEKRKEKAEKKFNPRKNGGYSGGSRLRDQEMKDMWHTVAGGDSEVIGPLPIVVSFSL